jgi:hypothetical protein
MGKCSFPFVCSFYPIYVKNIQQSGMELVSREGVASNNR